MLKNGEHHRLQTFSNDFSFLMIGKTRRICNIIDSIFFLMAKPKRSQRMKRLCQIVTCLAIIGHAQPTHHNTMQNKAPHPFTGQWITIGSLANLKPLDVFHRQLAPAKFKPEDQKARNQHVLFRKNFTLDSTDNATIFISADDYYKLYIGLSSERTEYHRRPYVLSRTYQPCLGIGRQPPWFDSRSRRRRQNSHLVRHVFQMRHPFRLRSLRHCRLPDAIP